MFRLLEDLVEKVRSVRCGGGAALSADYVL